MNKILALLSFYIIVTYMIICCFGLFVIIEYNITNKILAWIIILIIYFPNYIIIKNNNKLTEYWRLNKIIL